jgi:hypothetical protein
MYESFEEWFAANCKGQLESFIETADSIIAVVHVGFETFEREYQAVDDWATDVYGIREERVQGFWQLSERVITSETVTA